jgi:hypothetical protein
MQFDSPDEIARDLYMMGLGHEFTASYSASRRIGQAARLAGARAG